MSEHTPHRKLFAALLTLALGVPAFTHAADSAAVVTRQLPPVDAPNVVVVLLDDVGFGAAGTFGGPVETPSLDRLAGEGLRYNRFHTTAICSPTRAALLTGRNSHAAGVGIVMNSASTLPGYRGILRPETATIARVLAQNGYATSAWGKWHLVPDWEASQSGPFDRWPTGVGFHTFYGFLGGETDQYEPTLYQGTTPVVREHQPGYHLTEDLADRAIAWMHTQHAFDPERPFFVYFAPGAAHAPLQPPAAWLERYRGRFDQGWDRLREETFARQKASGVIPANAQLTPRPPELPAWDSLTPAQQRTAGRLMELFAAFLAHTDAQVGRLREALVEMGEFDNTLFVYIVGDNGSSGEGGLYGSTNYLGDLQGFASTIARFAGDPTQLLGENTFAHFPAAWAWATNTPFQWTKQVASHLGGTRNPMVLTWPQRIRQGGGLREQFSHVNDIVPTILEATGVALPEHVDGVPQRPLDGTSLLHTFDDPRAREQHRTQYFEIYGNRAIYHDGWMASAFRGRAPWQVVLGKTNDDFAADRWELYDLRRDFSQANDLAAREPRRLHELQQLFDREAAANGVVLHNPPRASQHGGFPNLARGRTRFSYHQGMIGLAESQAPDTKSRSHTIEARLRIPAGGAHGVIATMGGRNAGWSLYLDASGTPVYRLRVFDAEEITLRGDAPLGAGEHVLRYEFTTDGRAPLPGGSGRLLVNGRETARGTVQRVAFLFNIEETFDVGLDTGSAPGDYRAPYPFSATIERVDIELP
jgi:arylsulfatase